MSSVDDEYKDELTRLGGDCAIDAASGERAGSSHRCRFMHKELSPSSAPDFRLTLTTESLSWLHTTVCSDTPGDAASRSETWEYLFVYGISSLKILEYKDSKIEETLQE